MLQSMGSQRVGHEWVTEQQQQQRQLQRSSGPGVCKQGDHPTLECSLGESPACLHLTYLVSSQGSGMKQKF